MNNPSFPANKNLTPLNNPNQSFQNQVESNQNNSPHNQTKNNIQSQGTQILKPIYPHPLSYLYICLNLITVIIIGKVWGAISPQTRKNYNKSGYKTGIPFLRNYYFLLPEIFSLIQFIVIIKTYRNKKYIPSLYNEHPTLIKFLRAIRAGYFFTNIYFLVTFYMIYYCAIIPIKNKYKFKISGHVLASLFCLEILSNIMKISKTRLMALNKNSIINNLLYYNSLGLSFHIYYCILWTARVFHSTIEIIVSLIISCLFSVFIEIIDVDFLILSNFDENVSLDREPKNILYSQNKNIKVMQ